MGKSTCCGAVCWQHGARRRLCTQCKRTWRIRARKRGRPKLRHKQRLVHRVFQQRRSLTELAKAMGLTRQALSYRFLKALKQPMRPSGPIAGLASDGLILLADGLWFRFKRRPWVLYLMALRPVSGNRAMFIDPVMLQGPESRDGWIAAMGRIPDDCRCRVRALVCDNFRGSATIAARNGWVLQLCHFHMIAQLRARMGFRRPGGVSAKEVRLEGYRLVRSALVTRDQAELRSALDRLTALGKSSATPAVMRDIFREFVRRIAAYRAYLDFPEMQLPTTTGTVESMGRVIRDLMRRTRNVGTPAALNLWVTNYIRYRPLIACNGTRKPTN